MTDPWARPVDGSGADRPDGRSARPDGDGRGVDGAATGGTSPTRTAASPDPEQARVFSRPDGVDDAFDRRATPGGGSASPTRGAAPAPSLIAAFGRPESAPESLQRPATNGNGHATNGHDAHFWDRTAESDPWRDPRTGAELGGPAVGETRSEPGARGPGPRLSARELIFGRRVAPLALALLAAVALFVGAVGGAVGYALSGVGDSLTDPGAELVPVEPGKERPPGSVSAVAGRVTPAVVSLELRTGSAGAGGSGVVIDPQGYILTNDHVVELAATDPRATLDAVFASGMRAGARVVGRDPETDLAVVKVDVTNPRVAQLGRSSDLQVGDGVIAIGSPLGLAGTVTEGIVSSLQRPVRLEPESADANPVIDAVQTDAAINPGNSGGALVDTSGAVVGINTAIRTLGETGGGGSIGLGFAIPIDDARRIAESLIRTGGYQHTDLGVNAKSVTDGTSDGAQVLNVRQGGPGARAGLAEGDVVLRVDQRVIASADELVVAVREQRPGRPVTLGVIRGGRPLTLQAVL